jgi:hypothetical protein
VWLTVKSQPRSRAASPMLASSSRKNGCDSGSGRPWVRGVTMAIEPSDPIGPAGM